ncbi:PEGA domain-containing protein [Pseudoalteromonas denitrificans]|uniref:PEGA domain-containing protein n=1 Tax=Pseudoalteromonas denitrificans TaxID=43656 RepID=UPI0015A6560B|nr:PEGA domain-containing protein [Pseudoalteromonas denitrificans]
MNNDKQAHTLTKKSVIQPATFTPSSETVDSTKYRFKRKYFASLLFLMISLIALTYLFIAKSVVFETIPETKNLEVSGGLHLKLSDHYLMIPGDYELNSTFPGHYPLKQNFTVKENQNQTFSYSFKKLPGKLQLSINPKIKVTASIDNSQVLIKKGLISNIEAGNHTIIISADKYFDYEEKVNIKGMETTQELAINLSPAWAKIALNTIPSQVSVYEGEKLIGVTPLSVDLLEGTHQLTLKKIGYKDSSKEINVRAQKDKSIPLISLTKLAGKIHLTSHPTGASVTYGDNYLGKTPLKVNVIPDKKQSLLVFKDGYSQFIQILLIKSNNTFTKKITLAPILGKVNFKVSPSDALIYIDDRLMGRANQTITLGVKQQKITIKKEGYVSYQNSILPHPTLAQTFKINLRTVEQAKWDNISPVISDPSGGKLKLFKPKKTFYAGASRREQGRRSNEVKRTLNLSRPFYLGFTEVTNKQFKKFKAEHSSGHVKGKSLNGNYQPVVNIPWIQAAQFCNWLSNKENLKTVYKIENSILVSFDSQANGYRLPTEAEWIWATRFIDDQMLKYSWGDALPPIKGSGNFADVSGAVILGNVQPKYNDKFPVSAPVASFTKNEKGIFDLSGNVAEWSHDLYEIQTGLSTKTEFDPMGPLSGDYHVIRGSSWAHGTRTELRLSFRDYGNEKRQDLGFRIAKYAN